MRKQIKLLALIILFFLALGAIFLWLNFAPKHLKQKVSINKPEQTNPDLRSDLNIEGLFIDKKKPDYIFQMPDKAKQEEIKQGIEIWQKKQDENSLDPWLQEAILHSALDQFDQAVAVLDKAEEYFADDFRLFMNRASFFRTMGKYTQAAEDYLKAADLIPDKPLSYLELASLIEKFSQDKAKAEVVYDYALQRVPSDQSLELWKAYANFLEKIKDDKNQALVFWQKAYDLTEDEDSRQLIQQEIKRLKQALNE